MFRSFILAACALIAVDAYINTDFPSTIHVEEGETAIIKLPVSANYRREVVVLGGKYEEQLYRVCNGKNKKTCGYWESVKTKKKVKSGKTTYNKKKKALIIKNIMYEDGGKYMTGNKKKSRFVEISISFFGK
ncbi:unnamed protein product [Caenorhabditis brenneri]